MSNLFNNPDNLVDIVRQILSGKPIEEKEQKVAAYDEKGKQVGLYKNMADAKRLKPGHTYKPHKEELDPVNKKAVKKKFDDRKDKDIDNDGDVDSSDKFLHKRRKAISKAINEKDPKKKINASHCEEVELDEENLEENAAAIAALKKAYEPLRGKKISPENSKRLNDVVKKFDNNKSMLMKIAKADIPFVSDAAITRLITKHNMKGAEIKAAMKEETFNEEKDDDGEEKTVAQKSDPDGDGKADGDGKKKPVKKKKKKEEGDDEKDTAEIGSNKPDVIDTKPSIETSSMVSEAEGSVKVKAGPAHDKKVKSITGLAKKMGLKVTRQGKSDDGKMTTIHLSGNQKKILDMQALQSRLDEDKQELGKISKELAGASKMHKGQSDRIKAMLKKKDDTMKENREDGETNLVVQLRKAISLRGNKVRFADGKSVVISDKDAQKFMGMFSKLKKPAEKEMLMKSAAKSHKHFKMALAGRVENPKSSGLDLPKMKSEK